MAPQVDPMLDGLDGLRAELVAELKLTALTQERVRALFSASDEISLRKALAVLAADAQVDAGDGSGWDGYLTLELLKGYRYFDELSAEEFAVEAARGGF